MVQKQRIESPVKSGIPCGFPKHIVIQSPTVPARSTRMFLTTFAKICREFRTTSTKFQLIYEFNNQSFLLRFTFSLKIDKKLIKRRLKLIYVILVEIGVTQVTSIILLIWNFFLSFNIREKILARGPSFHSVVD